MMRLILFIFQKGKGRHDGTPDNEEHDHDDCNTGVIRESCDRPDAGGMHWANAQEIEHARVWRRRV